MLHLVDTCNVPKPAGSSVVVLGRFEGFDCHTPFLQQAKKKKDKTIAAATDQASSVYTESGLHGEGGAD